MAKTGSTAMAKPSYVKESNQGKEAIRQTDLKMPVLKLAQEKSPAVQANQVEIGQFFNNLTKEQFGESVLIIPVVMITGQTMFGKYKAGEVNILCSAPDGITAREAKGINSSKKPTNKCLECVNRLWSEDGEPPLCNENGRYLVLTPGGQMPMALNVQRISFQAHKTIATFLRASNYPAYAHVIKLSHTKHKSGALQILAEPQPGFAGEADYHKGEELYKSLHRSFTSQSVEGEAE